MLKLILKKSSSKNSSRLKSIQTDHIMPSIIKGDSQILEQQQVLGNQAMQQLSLINQRKISSEECLANPTIAASPQEPLKKTPEAIEEPAASKYRREHCRSLHVHEADVDTARRLPCIDDERPAGRQPRGRGGAQNPDRRYRSRRHRRLRRHVPRPRAGPDAFHYHRARAGRGEQELPRVGHRAC